MHRSTFGDVAVTPHDLGTQAAMEILAAGGNAVDAAVAANAVLGVVAPETCGIGGDLFALIHRPGLEQPLALNASGPAGSGSDPAELAGFTEVPADHALSVTVPGCVEGWEQLLVRCGRMPMSEVLIPAIRLATEGFPSSEQLSRSLAERAGELAAQSAAEGLYPDGSPPPPGARLHRPGLARTLSEIAAGGAEAFYGGMAGKSITEATGGRVNIQDLASYRSAWVEAIELELFGRTAWTTPPNSQGYLTLATLWMFSRLSPPDDPTDPAYQHALIEAYRAASFDRDAVLSDPAFSRWTGQALLAEPRLARRITAFDPSQAGRWRSPANDPGGTASLAVVDRDGIAISLIQSNYRGIGSGIGAGAAGFFLHNRGAGFTLAEHHPNRLAPGKRPRHTLAPTLWTSGGHLELLLGTRGGNQQPQLLSQVASHLFHARLAPHTAQALSRWTLQAFGPGEPSVVALESGLPEQTVRGLEQRGHRIALRATYEESFGPMSLISVRKDGLREAVADPRIPAASAAVR